MNSAFINSQLGEWRLLKDIFLFMDLQHCLTFAIGQVLLKHSQNNGFIHNVILIDGIAQAIWKLDKDVLNITRFESSNLNLKSIVNDFIASNRFIHCKKVLYSDS